MDLESTLSEQFAKIRLMANLFSVTAPLMIRKPNGEKSVMAALYPHRKGLLYFDLFWDVTEQDKSLADAAHIIEGKLSGEGPWRIGDHIIQVLGCQGSEPQLAHHFAQWQMHFEMQNYSESSFAMLKTKAKLMGAIVDESMD